MSPGFNTLTSLADAHLQLAFHYDAALLVRVGVQRHCRSGLHLHQRKQHLIAPEGAGAGPFGQFLVAAAVRLQEIIAHQVVSLFAGVSRNPGPFLSG